MEWNSFVRIVQDHMEMKFILEKKTQAFFEKYSKEVSVAAAERWPEIIAVELAYDISINTVRVYPVFRTEQDMMWFKLRNSE